MSQLLPWYSDPPYPLAVVPILEVWLRDPEFGRDLAQSAWVTDGIDRLEDDAIYGLGLLYDRDPALARRLLAYASEEPVRSRNTMFLGGLHGLMVDHGDKFEQLIAQPWFADGLDAGERAFITTISNTTGIDALYDNLLASPPAARSKTVSLPLAGEVTLWAFHNAAPPPGEDLLAMMERGVRGAERLMGAPFPLTDLIVLSLDVDDYDIGYGAVNFVDSVTLLWETERTIEETIVYHEIAHFYLTAETGRLWLYEGGASFIAEYVRAGDGGVPLNDYAPEYCRNHGVENIHALGDPNHPDPVADVTCAYLIGQHFLTHLFTIMGEAAFSSAMRELYERYLDYRYYPTDEEVYRVFLKHTPPESRTAFLDLYRRLHGGPFLNGN